MSRQQMINQNHHKGMCVPASEQAGEHIDHKWVVRRERGTRVRSQCEGCSTWTPWERVAEPVKKIRNDYGDLNNKSAESLRSLCRDNGIKGYSKMKKAELVAALQGV